MAADIEGERYFIRTGADVRGPYGFKDLLFMVKMKEVPEDAEYRSSVGTEWAPLPELLNRGRRERDELGGLIPKATDAVFYLGILVFFIGAFLLFAVHPLMGDAILVLSLVLEIGAVAFSIRNEPKAITKALGNIMAIGWTGFQGFMTIILIILSFTL